MAYETPQELVTALQSLSGDDRLDISAVKNPPIPRTDSEIQNLIDLSDLNTIQTATMDSAISAAVRTDEQIQSLIDASYLNTSQTAAVQDMIDSSAITDEEVVQIVRDDLIDDSTVSDQVLWTSEKIGQHIYTTPALYKAPSIRSISVDLEPTQQANISISGNRILTYSLYNGDNINTLAFYHDDTLITANISRACSYHQTLSFTIPDFTLSSGESTSFILRGTNTLEQTFEAKYILTGE